MKKPKIAGAKDGREVELPQDLDAITIQTGIGTIYIDISGPVPDMILLRTSAADVATRLILSPMDGRMAIGVIKA
jgi:hypothetical protein